MLKKVAYAAGVINDDYVAGMTWGWTGVRGTWGGPEAERSMDLMVERLGVTWTAITFGALQDTAQSTEIRFRDEPTVTDDEVRWAIRAAKARGLKVCLKPVVNVRNGTWRAHINFFDVDVPPEPTWAEWFASYTEFIVHHARIAADEGAEMLCIGCEMVQSDRRETEWRALIAQVREVYAGLVTYNCDKYQEDHVGWWDAVDVISSSGYYPVDDWENQLDRIEPVVAAHGKPFFFMEAGCPSRRGLTGAAQRLGAARRALRAGAGGLVPRGVRRVRAATLGGRVHALGLARAAVRRGRRPDERRLLPVRQGRRGGRPRGVHAGAVAVSGPRRTWSACPRTSAAWCPTGATGSPGRTRGRRRSARRPARTPSRRPSGSPVTSFCRVIPSAFLPQDCPVRPPRTHRFHTQRPRETARVTTNTSVPVGVGSLVGLPYASYPAVEVSDMNTAPTRYGTRASESSRYAPTLCPQEA